MAKGDCTIEFVDISLFPILGLDGVNQGILVILHTNHVHVVGVSPAWQREEHMLDNTKAQNLVK